MSFWSGFAGVVYLSGTLIASPHSFVSAQEPTANSQLSAFADLPDAPRPQNQGDGQGSQAATAQGQNQDGQTAQTRSADSVTDAQQSNSSTQVQSGHSASETVPASQEQTASKQVKQEEKQRVLGVIPNFNLTYFGNETVSLTAKQKFGLAIRSSIDPVSFVIPFFVAGYNELLDNDQGFPWGIKGLGERAGAAYLDALDGAMIGNAMLPSILHQDPRYYRLGHGTAMHRILYSASTSFICKHDRTGKWEPNYSNVGGNITAGALSNLYYPSGQSGAVLTIRNGLIVTAEGAIGSEFDEFWPDISRHIFHRDPTHGLDAQMRAEEEKKAEQKQ